VATYSGFLLRGFVMQKQPVNIIYNTATTWGIAFFLFGSSVFMHRVSDQTLPSMFLSITALGFTVVGATGHMCFKTIKATEERVAQLEQQLAGKTAQAEGE
jgi:hypothetical protein